MFPQLNIMVLGMRGAIRTIFWGMILLFVVTVSFAILVVQLIHPVNLEVAEAGYYDGCDRCPRAYVSYCQIVLYMGKLPYPGTGQYGDSLLGSLIGIPR